MNKDSLLRMVFFNLLAFVLLFKPISAAAEDTLGNNDSITSPSGFTADQSDSTADQNDFFDELEASLRTDYRLCTGDSSIRSTEELLEWRNAIDSISKSDEYPTIVRKYLEETGIHPSDARPCEIIQWMKQVEKEIRETSELLEQQRKQVLQQKKELLVLRKELAGLTPAPYDIGSLPFGISRTGFELLHKNDSLPPYTREGRVLRCDSITLGDITCKCAFHFNSHDRYWCYELESPTFSYDSLDTGARAFADAMATFMKIKTNTPPDHIYRIGRFDIIPGRLANSRIWNFPGASVYIGLARIKNRYYAKTIVQQR
jgi:hypothetical protein